MTLFVGHINERIKDHILHELFSPYGKISIIDRKGTYAFVEYEGEADTDRAIQELNKLEIMGTVIRVEISNRIRGELGPPPGDRSELCYNCLKVGHIAKNCPRRSDIRLPPQVMIQRQQQQQLLQLQNYQALQLPPSYPSSFPQPPPPPPPFIPQLGSSTINRHPHQKPRLSKREAILDRTPQKIRLNKLGSPRMRASPYKYSTHGSSSKADASWSQTQPMHSSLSPQTETGPTQSQRQRQKSVDETSNHQPDLLYPAGLQSSLAQGITQMAGQPAPQYHYSPDAASPTSPKGKHPQLYAHSPESIDAAPGSASNDLPANIYSSADTAGRFYPRSEFTDMARPHTGHMQGGVSGSSHPHMHRSNAQLVENPFLPPGTLIYMPMITVLPGTQALHQQQQRLTRPPLQSLAPTQPPHQHRSLSEAKVNTPFSMSPPRPLTTGMPKRHSLQSPSSTHQQIGTDNSPPLETSAQTLGGVSRTHALQKGIADASNKDRDRASTSGEH